VNKSRPIPKDTSIIFTKFLSNYTVQLCATFPIEFT